MTIDNTILNDFCALCQEYGLPCDPGDAGFNRTLLFIFKEKRIGSPWTQLDHIGDPSSVADIARLLVQVMEGDIKVEGRIRTIPYTNPETLDLLKGSLVGLLKQRIFRYGNKLVLSLSRTSAKIVSDNADGPEDGFTFDELDSIIQAVEGLGADAQKLQGKKAKKSESRTHTKDVSPLVKGILDALADYDFETKAKRYSFVADFLFSAGFLNFMDEKWKEDYIHVWKGRYKEKYDFIKAFID